MQAVSERETLLGTYVQYGVATPHAKTNSVKEPFVAYEKLEHGVAWGDNGEIANYIFMIGVPEEKGGNLHLKIISELSKSLMREPFREELFKHFNTGISYFLPVIIAGGMLYSFTLITGSIVDGSIVPSNQFWQNIYDLGQAGVSMMVPVMCAYIAYSIGSKPALAPGFILGYVANNPIGSNDISTGFLGALILGFAVGYFVKWTKTWKVPDVLKAMMPTFFIPLITTLVVGIFYIYILTIPINAFVQIIVSGMNSLNGTSTVLVGLAISGIYEGALWYVVDMLIGAAIIVLILAFTKPKLNIEDKKTS